MGVGRVQSVDASAGQPLHKGFAHQGRPVGSLGIQLGEEALLQRNADRTVRQGTNRKLASYPNSGSSPRPQPLVRGLARAGSTCSSGAIAASKRLAGPMPRTVVLAWDPASRPSAAGLLAQQLRCRFHFGPGLASDDIGFRVVCLPQDPSLNAVCWMWGCCFAAVPPPGAAGALLPPPSTRSEPDAGGAQFAPGSAENVSSGVGSVTNQCSSMTRPPD